MPLFFFIESTNEPRVTGSCNRPFVTTLHFSVHHWPCLTLLLNQF